MSLDLLQLQSLLSELQSRLELELELWIQYSYLLEDSEMEKEKDLVLAKKSLLHHQMGQVKDSLLQLESQMERAKALEWDLQ